MKYNLLLVISAIFLNSCSTSPQENKETVKEEARVVDYKPVQAQTAVTQKDTLEKHRMECEAYFKNLSRLGGLKDQYLNEVLSRKELSANNLRFLTALKNKKESQLAFEKTLSPIFRFSNNEIGITISPEYKQVGDRYITVSTENDLLKKYDTTKSIKATSERVRFYPTVLTTLFSGKPKPSIHYYTTKRRGTTQIVDLGAYTGECLEYFQYSLDTTRFSRNDNLLFSSPFAIDLEYSNYPNIDLLLQENEIEGCVDCPSSGKFEKTFAKVKGTDNVYFVYADTFPINDQLDTPTRALVLITEKKEVLYLWYNDIDLFGCSCL